MPLALYMDHHVPQAITYGLRLRDIEVLTAYEDDAYELEDADLLDRATELNRTLFTQDDDLLAEGARRQIANIPFCGIIYAHQLRVSIGRCVRDLEVLAKAGEPDDLKNEIIFLPL